MFRDDILADFSEFRRISKENGSFWRRACPGGARRAIRGARAVADVLGGHGTGGGAPEAPAARTRAQNSAQIGVIFAAQMVPLGSKNDADLGAVLRPSARCWRFRSTAAGSVAAGDVGNGARAAGSAPRAPRAHTAPKRAIFLRNPQNFEKSSKMSSRNTWVG